MITAVELSDILGLELSLAEVVSAELRLFACRNEWPLSAPREGLEKEIATELERLFSHPPVKVELVSLSYLNEEKERELTKGLAQTFASLMRERYQDQANGLLSEDHRSALWLTIFRGLAPSSCPRRDGINIHDLVRGSVFAILWYRTALIAGGAIPQAGSLKLFLSLAAEGYYPLGYGPGGVFWVLSL